MLIGEYLDESGTVVQTTLVLGDKGATISVDGTDVGTVPIRAILLAMRKFGRELDESIQLAGETIDLGSGIKLCELRFRATVDVEPRAYLVLTGDGPNKAALANEIAAALRHLSTPK